MIYLQRSFKHEDAVYHEIKIHTYCCKRDFLVREDGDLLYFDFENGEYVLDGMAKSIRQAIEFANMP
jgi:hypothetical protein